MKRESELMHFIVIPLVVYFLIAQIVIYIGKQAVVTTTNQELNQNQIELSQDDFLEEVNGRLAQNQSVIHLITNLLQIIVIYIFFYKEFSRRNKEAINIEKMNFKRAAGFILCILSGMAICLAVNGGVSFFQIQKVISSYSKFAQKIYSGNIVVMSVQVIIFAAAAEEMLFRGLLFRQMKKLVGVVAAAVLSSLLFAVFHGNLLQGMYAFLVGMLATYSYEMYRHMAAPFLVHMSANLISVVGTKSNVLKLCFKTRTQILVLTVIAAFVVVICIFQMWFRIRNRKGVQS